MSLTKSGIWYPEGNFTANPRVIAAQQAANLESVVQNERAHYGVVEFASTAARDAAYPSPQQGDKCSVFGSPMIYVTGTGWVLIKTAVNMQATSTNILPAGTTNSPTHVIAVPLINIVAADFKRLLVVRISISGSPNTLVGGYLQGLLYYDGGMVAVTRVINLMHVATIDWSILVAANTSHTLQFDINVNVTPTSGSASLSADGRFNRFIYDLVAA